jgi:type VI secretion system secreted protein VgrG
VGKDAPSSHKRKFYNELQENAVRDAPGNRDFGQFSTLASAQIPDLGAAQNFAVLGGSTVTNTGATNITGDVGVSPGSAITGFPPGVVTGTIYRGGPEATAAQASVATAYAELAGMSCGTNLTGQDLGGRTLTPGVYCFDTSAPLTGTLTLDAQGNSNAIFVFKIGTTLITASNSAVNVINGGTGNNVFFQSALPQRWAPTRRFRATSSP